MNHRTLWLASALVAFQSAGCRTDFNDPPIRPATNQPIRSAPTPPIQPVSAGPRPQPQATKPKIGDLDDPIIPGSDLASFTDGEIRTFSITQTDTPRSSATRATGNPVPPQYTNRDFKGVAPQHYDLPPVEQGP